MYAFNSDGINEAEPVRHRREIKNRRISAIH